MRPCDAVCLKQPRWDGETLGEALVIGVGSACAVEVAAAFAAMLFSLEIEANPPPEK